MAGRPSLRKVADDVRSRRAQFVDLALDLRAQNARGELEPDAPRILQVGGRWDNLAKRYVDDGHEARVLGLHGGQLEAADWLVRWFQAKVRKERLLENGKPIYSVLLHGGRRAGKTDLGAKSGIAYALLRPRSYVWLISENIPKTEELELDVRGWMPEAWYEHRGAPYYQFILPNGSVIWLRSAHNPKMLKRGRCDYAVLNEAQNMAEEAFSTVRAATADNGGLTVLCANPPETEIGFWIERFFEQARAGKRQAREFRLDSSKNPHIDHESLEAMREETDDRTFRREILGEFLPRADVVFHAWSNAHDGNVRPVPELPNAEITGRFLRSHLHRDFDRAVGVDLQILSGPPCAVEFRFFVDPDEQDGVLSWMTDYLVVEDGYEAELSAAMLERGWKPDRTALILDASGSWQGIDRTKKDNSFDLFRALGWRHLYKPDDNQERNPRIHERVAAANALMKSATGKRRIFSSPANLELNEAIKLWQNRNGVPYRRSPYAHLCDGATYPVWRFFPRKTKKPAVKATHLMVVDTKPHGPKML